jgi:hypothetical protein
MNEKISMGGTPENNKKLVFVPKSEALEEVVIKREVNSPRQEQMPEEEVAPELSAPQRKLLRSTLLALGIALTPMKDSNHSETAFKD